MIFDTHAHYDDEAFNEDRRDLLESLSAAGIRAVTNIGASLESCKTTLELTRSYPWMYAAIGVHPTETGELNEENFKTLEEMACQDKVVAVGEIGLDYYWDEPERPLQKEWFSRQLELARRLKKPVVIHSRDAARDTLDIMKSQAARDLGGVIHCFSYGKEIAREYLNMGYYLGIGGVLTFKNSVKLKEVVAYAPLEQLVLETDSPYLAPVPFRGKRNSSLNLSYVVEELAQIRGLSTAQIEEITWENALRLYGIEGK